MIQRYWIPRSLRSFPRPRSFSTADKPTSTISPPSPPPTTPLHSAPRPPPVADAQQQRELDALMKAHDRSLREKALQEQQEESGAEGSTSTGGEYVNPKTGEVNGPRGPEPTRYGDWERNGRVYDF